MKKTVCRPLFLCAALFSHQVLSEAVDHPFYVTGSVGTGSFEVERSGLTDDADGVVLGVRFGYHLTKNFAVEAAMTSSTDAEDSWIFGEDEDFDLETLNTYSAYGVLKTSGRAFIKAKLGYSHLDYEIEVERPEPGDQHVDHSENALSTGVGFGFTSRRFYMDVEYYRHESFADGFITNIGVNF